MTTLTTSAHQEFGEFLMSVRSAATRGPDARLMEIQRRAAALGATEAVPSDGGFLVAPEMAQRLVSKIYSTGDFLSRTTRYPVTKPNANGLRLPAIDEQSRATGSRFGGVQAMWANEATTVPVTRPRFRLVEVKLKKLIAFAIATEEVIRDGALFGAAMEDSFSKEMNFSVELAAFFGSGAGELLGILHSPALITIAKESGQISGTVVSNNITNMWKAMWGPSRRRACWFVHGDLESALAALTVSVGTAGGELPLFHFAESEDEPNLLMGRPVFVSEYSPTPGTLGDIVLCDPGEYLICDKDGLQSALSMHIRFLTEEGIYRFTWRIDGQPMWHTPVTPYSGGANQSPFVTLAAR